jgi:hypothetical protein
MIGTAEDHHSNPLKIAISKFKRGGGASSRSIPSAPATRPSPTSGFRSAPALMGRCILALTHEIIARDLIDRDFVARYTNGPDLVDDDEASNDFGLSC